MKGWIYALALLTIFYPLAAVLPLTFDELDDPKNNHQHVEIRGFIYQTDEGCWILSSEPNLRTCCVGSQKKVTQQIVINGELGNPSSSSALTVHGKFIKDPIWDEAGDLKQLYRLEEASIAPKKEWPWAAILMLCPTLIFTVLFLRRR